MVNSSVTKRENWERPEGASVWLGLAAGLEVLVEEEFEGAEAFLFPGGFDLFGDGFVFFHELAEGAVFAGLFLGHAVAVMGVGREEVAAVGGAVDGHFHVRVEAVAQAKHEAGGVISADALEGWAVVDGVNAGAELIEAALDGDGRRAVIGDAQEDLDGFPDDLWTGAVPAQKFLRMTCQRRRIC